MIPQRAGLLIAGHTNGTYSWLLLLLYVIDVQL